MSSIAFPDDLLDFCRELLRQTVGARAEIAGIQVLNHHHAYWVVLAQAKQPNTQLVIKLAGADAALASDFERTAALHQMINAQTSLKVAEVLTTDSSCAIYPWRYLVKTYIEGQEWRDVRQQLDAAQQRRACAQIGNAVAQIHSIRFPRFGELDDAAEPVGDIVFQAALRERAKKSIRQARLLEISLKLLEEREALFVGVADACLCHEDLHHRNLLFTRQGDDWELATVLDFEKAWAGHHEIDLARMEFWDGMVGDGFWSAYSTTYALNEGYAERRIIYQLLWCFEYALNSPRHLQDTDRLCEQLGLPAITSF
jgi:aminoglycoside phosphotransferase (APT) family kinase protein